MRRLIKASALVCALVLLTGCTAGRAFSKGDRRAKAGDWDAAVTYYRQAVQAAPNKPEYRIALERAMLSASHVHFENARQLEQKDQLDAALLEYRKTAEFDPSNRQAADRVVQLEKIIRDRIETSRPRPAAAQLRDQARQQAAGPLLSPASREPLRIKFTQASVRDILNAITGAAGISVVYHSSATPLLDRAFSIDLTGNTLEDGLNAVLSANGLFYVVQSSSTIMVIQDNATNRAQYERQLIVTFPIQYADVTELTTMLQQMTRPSPATTPAIISGNKTAGTITARATQAVMDVIRELITTNDKPRAEITLDVEVLEVNRSRAKQLGLNLSEYQIGGIFSPDQAPPGAVGAPSGSTGSTINRPFNLNTISQGISTADFYLALPQLFVRFLETDTQTKVLAQTQLRGAEGTQLTLNIGAREPYLATTFSPIASGGANVNPLSSYNFEQVGITVQATPRVTEDGDIVMPLTLSNKALGPSRTVGGSPAPSFTNREVTTSVRLRDGESHLLAGLLQDNEFKTMKGFPGLISVPGLRSFFSDTDSNTQQTDIVMLITPRIIRTHEYTAHDLAPIYVGTNQNFGLTGPPPVIASPADAAPAQAVPPVVPPQGIPFPTAPQGGAPGQVTTPTLLPPPPQPPPAPVPAGPPQGGAVGPLGEPQVNLAAPQTTTLRAPLPAQVSLTPPPDVRVAGGPYMVPVFVANASRLSKVTVTVSFNPAILRVRTIQEGSFLRQGAIPVTFTDKVDATAGRIDLSFSRTGDAAGASGSGLLAGIMFDAVAAGTSPLAVSGSATDPGGAAVVMQFTPSTVTVR